MFVRWNSHVFVLIAFFFHSFCFTLCVALLPFCFGSHVVHSYQTLLIFYHLVSTKSVDVQFFSRFISFTHSWNRSILQISISFWFFEWISRMCHCRLRLRRRRRRRCDRHRRWLIHPLHVDSINAKLNSIEWKIHHFCMYLFINVCDPISYVILCYMLNFLRSHR